MKSLAILQKVGRDDETASESDLTRSKIVCQTASAEDLAKKNERFELERI